MRGFEVSMTGYRPKPKRNPAVEKLQWSIVMVLALGTVGYAIYREMDAGAPSAPPPAPRPSRPAAVVAVAPNETTLTPDDIERLRRSIPANPRVGDWEGNGPLPSQKAPQVQRRDPLILAAIGCDVEEMRQLIDGGADINAKDNAGDTPLAWTIKRNCAEGARMLLERGAEVNAQAKNGFTPLSWAISHRHKELEALLRSHGADPALVGSIATRTGDRTP